MNAAALSHGGFWAAPGKFISVRLDGLLEHSRVDRGIFALAERSARTAMVLAGWRTRLRQRLAGTPPPAELVHLFPHAPQPQLRRWARAMAANDAKNRILCRLVRYHGVSRIYPLLRVRDNARLRDLAAAGSPAILVFAHTGAAYGVAAGLGMMGVRSLLLTRGDKAVSFPPIIEAWHVQSHEQPILFLKRAADFLGHGGCVMMALDGTEGGSFANLDILGRSVRFPRGIQVLRKLASVPVIPVGAPWAPGGRIDFVTYPPLVTTAGTAGTDEDVMHRAVRWLETQIVRDPRQLRSQYLGQFVNAPHSDAAGSAAISNRSAQPPPRS